MRGLLAILVVASPFVYWLFRSRAGNRADRKIEERSPALDEIIAEQRRTAPLEVEATLDRPPLPRQEVESVDHATGETEADHVDGLEPTTLPHTKLEPDNSTYADVKAQVIKDAIGELVPESVVASAHQTPSPEPGQSISIPLSKPFPEELRDAAVAEVPDLSGSGSAGEAKSDVISAAAVADRPPQAD